MACILLQNAEFLQSLTQYSSILHYLRFNQIPYQNEHQHEETNKEASIKLPKETRDEIYELLQMGVSRSKQLKNLIGILLTNSYQNST
ncbi:hypothetical protein BpHYR1_007974 [Brachionus plicatilis]|uniref:Uncharacterized protein n=1 Tax=Brachionus plicatilis TaxID=10195 RepID=A0A3M7RA44_BRAPC|nr:hypothetical protein BpHYR1_007974 [Brachionus plicatilis]